MIEQLTLTCLIAAWHVPSTAANITRQTIVLAIALG